MKISISKYNDKRIQEAIKNNQPLDNFDTSKMTSMYTMFCCAENFNQPLSNFDTSNVTSMHDMFYKAKSFNQPLDNFDTSKVTTMRGMFFYAESFNQPLDNFDTRNVTNMEDMFCRAKDFNQPLDKLDLRSVSIMCGMFAGAKSLFIGYIMRFAAKAIFLDGKYNAMWRYGSQYSTSEALDNYIKHINKLKNKMYSHRKIQSALDGFIVD